jgi:hypothetical protein
VVRTHVEHQQARAILGDQAIVDAVVGDAGNTGAFAGGGDDCGDGLLARVEARCTDCEIGYATGRQAFGIELVNRDAVRTTLTDKETTMDAVQRPDLVSILAGG